MTAVTPPESKNPDAASAYASALRRLHDASRALAAEDLERATELDPGLAAAHLRAVLYYVPSATLAELREHYAAASHRRDALDARDRLLLQVAEGYVADAPSPDTLIDRARAVTAAFPDDAEAALVLGEALALVTRHELARAAFSRALELDPAFSGAVAGLADSHHLGGDDDRALELYGRCVAMSPSAGDCLRGRAEVSMTRGRCDDADADARRMLVVEPKSYRTYEYLALAVAGRNAPIDGVRDALAKRTAMLPEARRKLAAAQAATWLALLAGDLAGAEASAREWEAALGGSLIESDHARPLGHLFDALEERGDDRKVLAEADAIEKRASAWTRDDPLGVRLRIATLRHRAGKLDDAALGRLRDELIGEARAKRPDLAPVWVWYLSYARFAASAAEARAALASMPAGGPPPEAKGLWEHHLGRMHLLAGDAARALPFLRHAAAACSVLSSEDSASSATVEHVRANLLLGRALEDTRDDAGACRAYAAVIARWRGATLRSRSLDEARRRVAALGCKP